MAFWISTKRNVGLRDAGTIFAVIALFAVFDEVTQIPVGRTCDARDALADWIGCPGRPGGLRRISTRVARRGDLSSPPDTPDRTSA